MGAGATTPKVVAGLLTGLLIALTGCGLVPSRPSAPEWVADARLALDDTASEVATVRLVVEQEQQDRLPTSYAVVVAVRSEEAASTAADGLTKPQPPTAKQREYDAVAAALGDAADLLAEVRIALVDHDTEAYPGLATRLATMQHRLEKLDLSGAR
jgi:hypothetical protein